MRSRLIGFLFVIAALHAQPVQQVLPNPDCQVFFALTTSGQASGVINKLQQGCTTWEMAYTVSGFSPVSVLLQSAANNGSGGPATFGTGFPVQQTILSGTNPGTSTTAGFLWVQGVNAFARVLMTGTGPGIVQGALFGWRIPNAGSSGGGGGITCLTGDVTAGSGSGCTTATVVGLETVPFCSGYTPTNGQFVQYTTGGSPNPCYTAAAASGGGGSGNGVTVYSGVAGISLSGTIYFPIGGGADASALPGTVNALMETGGTLKNFGASISIATGNTTSVVLTVYQNFATTPITCTITNPATTCSDTTHSITFAAGDTISVQAVFTGSIVVTPTFVFTSQVGATGSSGSFVLIEEHTASSSAALSFTSCISSTYDEYKIEFVSILPANDAAELDLQFSTNGGSSYDGGSNYAWVVLEAVFNGTGNGGSNPDTKIVLAPATTNSGTNPFSGSVTLYNPLNATASKNLIGDFVFQTSTGDTRQFRNIMSGTYRVNTAANAFQISSIGGGNIASGTIRCYGLAK